MSATQLSFSLRAPGVKTVHLAGSWDNYAGQLPLSRDKTSSKAGAWKGTFRFQPATLEAGKRYWYYYVVDGCRAAHNPSVDSVVEPTSGRALNVLDVPARLALDIPHGRPLSVSQIKAPKPVSPHATKRILHSAFDDLEELAARFGSAGLEDDDDQDFVTRVGPVSRSGSALSYSSDGSASDSGSGSGSSGYSTPASDCSSCSCERFGITRRGERVRLDCGGSRCGYYSSEDSCSSEDEDDRAPVRSRRNGIIVN